MISKFLFPICILSGCFGCLLHNSVIFSQCPNGFVYTAGIPGSSSTIGVYDPAVPFGAGGVNPSSSGISLPAGANGLSYGPNLNGGTPSPTFYTVSSTYTYLYWNGSAWINTGHSTGGNTLINIAQGPGCMYSFAPATGNVYLYTGSGNATLLCTLPFTLGGPYDIVADANCNFYVLKTTTSGAGQHLYQYDSSGTLINTWNFGGTAVTSATAGTSLAIVGNTVVFLNSNGLYEGTISGSTINFSAPIASTSFSNDFANCVFPASILLPIELTLFEANCNNNFVNIIWETESQLNCDYFTVESSGDDLEWTKLADVDAAGTSNSRLQYRISDERSKNGTIYYRIKQTDFDGVYKYSTIISSPKCFSAVNTISIYPNPGKGKIEIVGKNLNDSKIELFNNLGEKLSCDFQIIDDNQIELNAENLANGLYYLKFYNSSVIESLKLEIIK